MSGIDKMYHAKQQEVMRFAYNNDFFMLINSGAKRSGKTVLNNDLFLQELRKAKKLAKSMGVDTPQYILAGADQGAIQRNVLSELSNKYGIEFHFDRYNRFMLFGVQVCCFGHSKINDLGRIRGMTAFGAYINEGSIANREVFDEIKSRCSGEGARILVDTNPSHPEHWLKKEYMDKSDGRVIQSYNYRLDDNTFLSERYRANIKASTPSGVFYDRNIEGLWCMADGVVYPDFNENIHYISRADLLNVQMVKYIGAYDFGWNHHGALCVIGIDVHGNHYLVHEVAEQFKDIEWWVEKGLEVKRAYGNIIFYCDYARPDYIDKLRRAKLKARNADKTVMEGIAFVAGLFKQNKLYIVKEAVTRFKDEIYNYVWKKDSDEPVKAWDDVLDTLRYACYSNSKAGKVLKRDKLGV